MKPLNATQEHWKKSRTTVVDNSLMISKNYGATTSLRWATEQYKPNKDLRVEARQEYDRKMDDRRDRKIQKGCGAEGELRRSEEKADKCEGKEGRERSG